MTDSHSLPEAIDPERQDVLTHFKSLGFITEDTLSRINSASSENFQNYIKELINIEQGYQSDFRQLIAIREVIEKYLSHLVSEMLDGRDIIEPLRKGMDIYPSMRFIRWLVDDQEKDLDEFIKYLNLDSDDSILILYQWQCEYKPLNDVWWEIERRQQGRENHWTGISFDIYHNEARDTPQVSIRLLSRKKVIWNTREDIDDIAALVQGLLRLCLRVMGTTLYVRPPLIEGMNRLIRSMEEVINELKDLPILNPQNTDEDSTDTQEGDRR
jgi:hypothetical protein